MTKPVKNFAASVRQRLLNLSKENDADYNAMLQRFTRERFLYRLGMSSEVDRFTLKGAALFVVWGGGEFRPTKDVDLLGSGSPDHAVVRRQVEAVLSMPCPEDGLTFEPSLTNVESIHEEEKYVGVRVRLEGRLGRAKLPLQVDIGFGDAVTPGRSEAEYPTLLDLPIPRIWTYPRETVVAEKFEVMVRRGLSNTRLKDFWDIGVLARRFSFDGETLRSAIDETFRRRGTPHTSEPPEALAPTFYEDVARARQWQAFQRKMRVADASASFGTIGQILREFLGPVHDSLAGSSPFTRVWPAAGPWRPR